MFSYSLPFWWKCYKMLGIYSLWFRSTVKLLNMLSSFFALAFKSFELDFIFLLPSDDSRKICTDFWRDR